MKDKVRAYIIEKELILGANHVVCAFSGGADSVAMLDILAKLRAELRFSLSIVHLNHGLRDDAKRDEDFVRKTAEKMQIEADIYSIDVGKRAAEEKKSIELMARICRYEIYQKALDLHENSVLATGHTATDDAETILHNIIRGTGISGLLGIPEKRGRIIRPILTCTRKEIEDYTKESELSYVTDHTNFQSIYTRNKIRLEIIPSIKEINENFEANLLNLAHQMARIEEHLENEAKNLYENAKLSKNTWDRETILKCDGAVVSCMIKKIIKNLGYEPSFELINLIKNTVISGSGAVMLGENCVIKANETKVFVENLQEKSRKNEFETRVVIGENDFLGGKKIHINEVNIKTYGEIGKLSVFKFSNLVFCDRIIEQAILRTRRPGDKIYLPKRGVTKTLRKLFSEEKIPIEERDKLAVLEYNGKILWLENFGSSQENDMRANAQKAYEITVI